VGALHSAWLEGKGGEGGTEVVGKCAAVGRGL